MKKNKGHRKKERETCNDAIYITEFGRRLLALLPPIPPHILETFKKADKEYWARQQQK